MNHFSWEGGMFPLVASKIQCSLLPNLKFWLLIVNSNNFCDSNYFLFLYLEQSENVAKRKAWAEEQLGTMVLVSNPHIIWWPHRSHEIFRDLFLILTYHDFENGKHHIFYMYSLLSYWLQFIRVYLKDFRVTLVVLK